MTAGLSLAGSLTLAASVEDAHTNLVSRFVGSEELLRDHEGETPTPEDCRDGRPNAMGWWNSIENGPMFTGVYSQINLCEFFLAEVAAWSHGAIFCVL